MFAVLYLFLQLSKEYDESEEPAKETEDAELILSPFLQETPQAGTSDNLSFEEKVRSLTELVEDKVSREEVEQVLRENGEDIQLAASSILTHSVDPKEAKKLDSLETLLTERIAEVMSLDEDIMHSVKRTGIWKTVLSFYKAAQGDPNRLKKNFMTEFEEAGEVGVDGGALKIEFFEMALKELNWRLFEGESTSRLPRKSCDNITLFKIAGMLICHSVMQKGPTFAVFPEWFFDIICSGDPVSAIESVSIDDVPINAASSNLRSLIQKLDEAKTYEEIDQI